MSNPNADPVNPEIKVCPELRDKIFEYLPPQARNTLRGVEVKFWPNHHGEMELHLTYDPTDNVLDIDAVEGIYGPSEKLTGSLVKGCELDSETGEVHAYGEHMVSPGMVTPVDPTLAAAENDATRFDTDKLSFLLKLFDRL